MANSVDPDQTASDLAQTCLSENSPPLQYKLVRLKTNDCVIIVKNRRNLNGCKVQIVKSVAVEQIRRVFDDNCSPTLKKWGLYWICLVRPSFCHSVTFQSKIFHHLFSGTVRPRRLKHGTHVDSGQMYHVYRNLLMFENWRERKLKK